MKADGGLNATAAPVIMAAGGGRWPDRITRQHSKVTTEYVHRK